MCQMKQIKCNNDTVLTEVTMFLLEDFVLLVDFVDLIAPALGISFSTHILFFSLCIFSILEHAAACYSLKSWTAFALVFVSSVTLLLDSVSVPSSTLLKWQEKDVVWHEL